MTNPERLIRSIVGDIRPNIYPFACASEITGCLFFTCHIPLEDIHAKQVYPLVAERLGLSSCAASRRIQRLARICWDCMLDKGLVLPYIGRIPESCPNSCRLAGYLSFYAYLRIPYFEAIDREPSLLFAPSIDLPRPSEENSSVRRLSCDRALPVSRVMLFDKDSFPICPGCGCTLEREYQCFCDRCGQHLDWSDFSSAVPILPGQR